MPMPSGFVRSIKEECLNRVVPLGEGHVRLLVGEYVDHDHRERNHQGLDNQLLQRPPPPVSLAADVSAAGASGRIAQFLPPGGRMSGRPIKRTLRGRRGPTTHHVVPDRGFSDRDAELEQLAVDARGAPGRVGAAHLADEFLNGARDAGPPGPTRPTLPAPVEPKASSMPAEDRVGLDDDERVPPTGPQVTQPRPEQPVDWPQPRSPSSLSLQDRQLMAQRGVLDLKRRLAPQARPERGEQHETHGSHGPGRLPGRRQILNVQAADEIFR